MSLSTGYPRTSLSQIRDGSRFPVGVASSNPATPTNEINNLANYGCSGNGQPPMIDEKYHRQKRPRPDQAERGSELGRRSQNPEERHIGASRHRRVQCTMRASIAYLRALHAVQRPANFQRRNPRKEKEPPGAFRCSNFASADAREPHTCNREKSTSHKIREASHVAFKVSAHCRHASLGLRSLSAGRQRGEILRAIEG